MFRALLLLLGLALPAYAEEVDVELALMVDVSRSMLPAELALQRRGYAEALRSDEVLSAVQGGFLGRVALSYMEWSWSSESRVIVPWTLIETRDDAEAFANALEGPLNAGSGRTSIAFALDFATQSILTNNFNGLRTVIDISGDGPNNAGPWVNQSRDRAVEAGMVINGLPLMTRDGAGQAWHLEDLDDYYRACVIGGPGAFLVPVHDWKDLADAVRQKIVLELAEISNDIWPAQATPAYDCQIGEKLWEEFRRRIDLP